MSLKLTFSARPSLVAIDIGPRLRESGIYTAAVVFDVGRLEVCLANGDAGLEPTLVLEHTIPGFVPFDGYVGFAGATGSLTDEHVVYSLHFDGLAVEEP